MRCPEIKLNSILSSNFFTTLRHSRPQIKILLIALAAISTAAFALYRHFASPKKSSDTSTTTSPNTSSTPPSASALPIEVRAPNTDLLQTILNHGEQFVNGASRALIVKHNETKYCLWWNPSHRAMNIQTHQDFLHESSDNKLGIKNNGQGNFSYVYNNNPLAGVPVSFPDEIFGLFAEQFELLDQFERNKNVFDSATLRVMFNAIKAKPQHITVKNSTGAFLREGTPLVLRFEQDAYAIWITQIENSAPNANQCSARSGRWEEPSAPQDFFINIQKHDSYLERKPTNKLGLKLDSNGTIESCYIDSQPNEDISQNLFHPNADWNKILTSVMNEFLKRFAVSMVQDELRVHQLAITQIPEHVLHIINWPHLRVKFLKDDFTPEDGIDAGGLTKDLLTQLSKNLLDGSYSRVIQLEAGTQLPEINHFNNELQTYVLTNLGKLFSYCMTHTQQSYVTGRVLPDSFFALLKEVCTFENPPNNDQILEAFGKIKETTEHGWLFDYAKDPDMPLNEDQTFMLGEDCLDLKDADQVKAYIVQTWRSRVDAAWTVARELTPALRETVQSLSAIELSTQIQGDPFNREEIAGKITTHYTDPVIREKTQWLKELVRTEEEEWVKNLLKYVTSNSVVTAHTMIYIQPHADPRAALPMAHTCFQQLDVPRSPSRVGTVDALIIEPKILFRNNLTFAMSQTGYDVS